MQWIFASLLISVISAWVFWDQSPVLTYRAASSMFSFLFFFYLCKKNPPLSFLEKFVWFFALLFCVFYVYAYSQIPELVFRISEEDVVSENMSRGIIRVNFTGDSFVILAFFLALNKYYVTGKKYFFGIASLFYFFIVLQVTRQTIVFSALVAAGYLYLKNKKLSVAIVCIVVASWALGNTIKFSDDSVAGSLIALTEAQVEENKTDENTRIKEYEYFFSKYSKNIVTSVIGNGMPHSESSYGYFYENLKQYDRLFLSDVGYAMMFAVNGILGLMLYLLLFYKCSITKVPDELVYARMFMIYAVFANIGSGWYAKADAQLCMSICVYILMLYGRSKKKLMTKI